MKSSKFFFAFIAILAVTFTVFAFTVKKAPLQKGTVIYHYTSASTALQDMQDTSNWEIVVVPNDCGNVGDVPCAKEYSDDWDDFITYLNGFSSATALADDADSRKSSGTAK